MEAPGPDGSGFEYEGWTFAYSSPDIMKYKHDELFAADALLLGRITYEGFAKAWPAMQGTGDFGERMNSIPKYVVSKTVEKADWNNSTIIIGNVTERLAALKEEAGQDILIAGSGELINSILPFGLI